MKAQAPRVGGVTEMVTAQAPRVGGVTEMVKAEQHTCNLGCLDWPSLADWTISGTSASCLGQLSKPGFEYFPGDLERSVIKWAGRTRARWGVTSGQPPKDRLAGQMIFIAMQRALHQDLCWISDPVSAQLLSTLANCDAALCTKQNCARDVSCL